MTTFEYKVISIPTSIPLGAKGYEKIATEFEATATVAYFATV